jgi:asparagine synthase (glutamine-hydrolysing)
MSNEDGTVWITYNGEIYNFLTLRHQLTQSGHTFRSQTDTEVIVHGYEEWGIHGVLARLQGMFAFALYDARQRPGRDRAAGGQLILARDRLGIKPLYYTRLADGEGIIFALR